MRFWDASAIVPLISAEVTSAFAQELINSDPEMLGWWGSYVECVSALTRQSREGGLDEQYLEAGLGRLRELALGWNEIGASDLVRANATRLLRVHPLRAADALQLGALCAVSEGHPRLEFVTFDLRLGDAARKEGFVVRDATPG